MKYMKQSWIERRSIKKIKQQIVKRLHTVSSHSKRIEKKEDSIDSLISRMSRLWLCLKVKARVFRGKDDFYLSSYRPWAHRKHTLDLLPLDGLIIDTLFGTKGAVYLHASKRF